MISVWKSDGTLLTIGTSNMTMTSNMTDVKRFVLPISPNYVSHWGLWEAVREILQNALDERTRNGAEVEFDWDEGTGTLTIGNSTGILEKKSLILGNTDKDTDKKLRGKFGEGYKLALLVLLRNQKGVTLYTGDECWTPEITHDPEYDADVLSIRVEKAFATYKGTTFRITNIDFNDWQELNKNVLDIDQEHGDDILMEPNEQGRIYVGGLYVNTVEEYAYGYSFKPETVTLDRDRGMIENFNLAYAASRLWANRKESELVLPLLMERKPDVHYIENHADRMSPVVGHVLNAFELAHGGDAIPVESKEEIEAAIASGRKWVVVPRSVRNLIAKVKSLFVPRVGTPVERLKKLVSKTYFADDVKQELLDIIKSLGG